MTKKFGFLNIQTKKKSIGELYAFFPLIRKKTIKSVSQFKFNPIKNLNCLNEKKMWVCQIIVGELYALFLILKITIKIVSQLRSNPIKNLNCLNKICEHAKSLSMIVIWYSN